MCETCSVGIVETCKFLRGGPLDGTLCSRDDGIDRRDVPIFNFCMVEWFYCAGILCLGRGMMLHHRDRVVSRLYGFVAVIGGLVVMAVVIKLSSTIIQRAAHRGHSGVDQ